MSDKQPGAIAPASQTSTDDGKKKKEAVQDAERFINALFRGLSGELDDKLDELKMEMKGYVDEKFTGLHRALGFAEVSLDGGDVDAPQAADGTSPKPAPATAAKIVTLKDKIDEQIGAKIDSTKQDLENTVENVKVIATQAQDSVKSLETRISQATVTSTFNLPAVAKPPKPEKPEQPEKPVPPQGK